MTEIVVNPGLDKKRYLLMTLAGVLLNLGLFVVLAIFSPVATGIIIGYLLRRMNQAVSSSALSAVIGYGILFALTESVTGWTTDPTILVLAVIIMAVFCVVGGVLGVWLSRRSNISS